MPAPKICLYAEALTNIRQLTLHASLQTDKNEHTKILVSSDKKIITALHDGESSSIYLPTQISGTAHVTFPIERRTEISARLQIDDANELKSSSDELSGPEVPWTALDLTEEVSIRCKECDARIVEAGNVATWKDLPSENWAELMDFWFCHKPHHGHSADHDHAAEAKGFSSKSKIASNPGTGLVDIVSFLLRREDCSNLEEINSSQKQGIGSLQCASCKTGLGSCAEGDESCRLYKSRLAVIPKPGQPSQSFPTAIFLAAQLLALIESSIGRKVVVHDGDNRDQKKEDGDGDGDGEPRDGLLLWVFNPDIYYSSSKRGPTAHRAMKVFYKTLPDPLTFLYSDTTNNNTHEELVVPKEDFIEFLQTLQDSTEILPQSARTFQDWNVGLLDRWEKNATGSARMDENPLNKKVDDGFELFKLPPGMEELYR